MLTLFCMGDVRIYVAGRVLIEHRSGSRVDRTRSGDLERTVLALLVLERHRPVTIDEVARARWGDKRSEDWRVEVNECLDRLDEDLRRSLTGSVSLDRTGDMVQLRVPPDAWVDVEHAHLSREQAAAALEKGDLDTVVVKSTAAAVIGKRHFLPGVATSWADSRRADHAANLLQGLLLRAKGALQGGAPDEAVRIAKQALQHDDLHEPALRMLMRALDVGGNRAEALKAYEDYRTHAARAVGAKPSQATEALAAELVAERDPALESLTPRQREVAVLVAGGLTNRHIADRLHISVQTAETHVKHIRMKLGVTSRSQVAALVARIR